MNIRNGFFACLLVAGLTSLQGCRSDRQPVAPADDTSRYIRFAEKFEEGKPDGDQCSVTINSTVDWSFANDDPCKNDQMSYFQLDNVRSATGIELESRHCDDSGGWVFALKTYIDPVSTGWIKIEDLKGRQPGYIVQEGVYLEWKKREDEDQIKGKLSCVRVRTSR
ncbi:hypothetical protein KDX38_22875 [Pseudomonas sp. CDFA 602]|uniref:hypothetical protein n=1 Tax=Pseudomonas californiensis TaxID=2829823 RepID=UPI001E3565A8|nr:hypothetical protein [Pseudomonas californiensis]MCD5996457.1 hypothetical protein [Pseudomonas californiensis]MCD6002036.1 hypothetical protein [Pseudomonas californiensis]